MSTEYEWSEKNSKKLDRILFLIEGDGADSPGLSGRVRAMEKTLFGDGSDKAITTKVNIMWRAHVWLLCSISAGLAIMGEKLIRYLIHF